jgi:molybdopterin converting factor small subunit
MVRVVFTENIQRHVACPQAEAEGATVREVLEAVFAANARARAYVLDEQGALRRHMAIIVDGRIRAARGKLSDPVEDGATIHVLQALSGG